MSTSTERVVPATTEPPDRRRWFALIILILASFMDLLDVTIVNVAVPTIQRDLGASYAAIQWVTAGYTLGFAAGLITGGRLGDIYGRRRMLMLGIVGFTVSSLLCGVAVSPGMLLASRLVQGVMASLMVPQILAIIHVTFSPRERGKVFGVYAAVGGLALISGPILGGVLIEADLFGWGWRTIFLVNVPVGIVAIFAGMAVIRESRSPEAVRLDIVGVILATTSVLMLVYPLVQGRERGWPAWSFALMGGSAVLFAFFIGYERRLTRRGGSPLIVLALFRSRSFSGGFAVNLLFNVAYGMFFLMWTLFMQVGLGWSAIRAGLTGIPFFVGMATAAGVAVQTLTPKFGRTVLVVGGLLLVAGSLLFAVVSAHYGTEISSWQMAVPLFVMGLGMGYVIAPLIDFALTDVPHESAGSASGAYNTTWQLGTSIGFALLGVIFLAALPGQSGKGVDSVEPQIRDQLAAAQLPDQAQDDILAGYRACAEDRARQTDPTAVPASCRTGPPPGVLPEQGAKIGQILLANTPKVQAETFSRSFRIGLYALAGAFILITILMRSLPKFAVPQPKP